MQLRVTNRCACIDFIDVRRLWPDNRFNRIDFWSAMLITIKSPGQLGLLIRAVRKHQKIRMDDIAGSAGVGPVFVREVERGKETVQLGRVMQILAELGIELQADVPDEVKDTLAALTTKGVKPFTPRKTTATAERAAPAGQEEE
jgi:transcriptional regulator with XRE-family HTH domain